uniref:Cryptochrome DASH n=1 Tax=Lingulaulax polyedra TaxID=160621 RepID=A0A516AGA4_LINPO|nr:cryptochrome DASH [Lingulodinium polyedra]
MARLSPRGAGVGPHSNSCAMAVEAEVVVAAQEGSGGSAPVFVVWHKWSDLRLLDHEPLVNAHARAAQEVNGRVLHVYLLERELLVGRSRVAGVPRCGARRAAFWRDSLEDLARRLEGHGQRLLVCTDAPDGAGASFERICRRLPVRAVFAHTEFCDEELRTQAAVKRALSQHGASLQLCWGGLTLHHIDDLGFNANDKRQMPDLYQAFLKKVRGRPVRKPLPVPSTLRPPPSGLVDLGAVGVEGVAQALASLAASPAWTPPPDGLGKPQAVEWIGGETAALAHWQRYVWEEDRLRSYVGATDSMTPGENNAVNSGTRLSPWLAFGCLSARTVLHEVRKYERARGKSRSTYWVYHELIFRDFLRFSTLLWRTSLFQLVGPYGVRGLEWRRDAHLFKQWQEGRTGFPFVDAGMRELAATGFISHLHRQCCAAFLVRDLRLDWRMGAEHFEAMLLDYTPDANWGNWAYRILQRPQLVANGCPVVEHLTTVEIVAWPVVHDARLEHILAWLPELRALPRDLAREPWRLESEAGRRVRVKPYRDSPLWFCSVNRANWQEYEGWMSGHAWTVLPSRPGTARHSSHAGFVLGRDYPRPMVPPLNVEVDLDRVPVAHAWGDTPAAGRPHVWGQPGVHVGEPGPAALRAPTPSVSRRVFLTEPGSKGPGQQPQGWRDKPPGVQPRRRWAAKRPIDGQEGCDSTGRTA